MTVIEPTLSNSNDWTLLPCQLSQEGGRLCYKDIIQYMLVLGQGGLAMTAGGGEDVEGAKGVRGVAAKAAG